MRTRLPVLVLVVQGILLGACGSEVTSPGTDPSAEPLTTPGFTEAPTLTPEPTQPLTPTPAPGVLVIGEVVSVPGMSSVVGTGTVTFEQGSDPEILLVTLDGEVEEIRSAGDGPTVDPESGETTGGTALCILCVEHVLLAPNIAVPIDALSLRPAEAYGDLHWIVHEGGSVQAHFDASGSTVRQTWAYDVSLDIPLATLADPQAIVAGPDGSQFQLTADGLVLEEGSAQLVERIP